jgi:hypothetical protein
MLETIERQQRYKDRYEGGTKTDPSSKKKKSKNNENQSNLFKETVDNLEALVENIGHLHPANEHMKSVALPLVQQETIAAAIERDGFEAVLSGTKNLAERVAQWPKTELRFIPNPVRFYREAEYLRNPDFWERKFDNGREECALHPNSGVTQWGTCWGCYATKYTSGCEPA